MMLLQIQQDTSYGAIVMALISILLLILLSASGKIQLGFSVAGLPTPLYRSRKKILSQYFSYYQNLTGSDKKRFEHRVQAFISSKKYHGRNIAIDELIRVLIAACAVQLTFGLPKILLSHFERIIVYPNDYYSTIHQRYHRGEINPRLKAIVLSWHHFLDGYVKKNDGINLGLHEMAHALHLENMIFNEEYDFLDRNALSSWERQAQVEMTRIRQDEGHLFRQYATVSEHEFFAVAVENFFERSEQFQAHMPDLYHAMTLILKQNPLST